MPPRFTPDAMPVPEGPDVIDPRARLAGLRDQVDATDPRMIADNAIRSIQENPNMSNAQAVALLRRAADFLSGLTDRATGSRRFAALQSEGRVLDRLAPRNQLAFERLNNGAIIHRNQNFIEYQTVAEQLARCGWRLARINGHCEDGESRFDSMWIRSPMGSAPFFTAHDMTEEGYMENRARHLSLGYIETMVSQYEVNGEPRYWAVWEQGLRTPNGTMPAGFVGDSREFGPAGVLPRGFEGGALPPGFRPGVIRPGLGRGVMPSGFPPGMSGPRSSPAPFRFGPASGPGFAPPASGGFGIGPAPAPGGPVRFPPGFRG